MLIRKILCLLAIMSALPTIAQIDVKSTAEAVTIFIEGAQVERSQNVDIQKGTTTLRFVELSPYIDRQSIRVSGIGEAKILSTGYELYKSDDAARDKKIMELTDEIKKKDDSIASLSDKKKVIETEKKFLSDNSNFQNRTTQITTTQMREFAQYYTERLTQLLAEERAIDDQIEQIEKDKNHLNYELSLLYDTDYYGRITVSVESEKPQNVKFELTYYTLNASWIPNYDITAQNLSQDITLKYKASVIQTTNEKWENVSLTLSTALPSIGNVAPTLRTYNLNFGVSAPKYSRSSAGNIVQGTIRDSKGALAGAIVKVDGSTISTTTDANGFYSLTVPDLLKSSLTASYADHKTKTVHIGGNNSVNISLETNEKTKTTRKTPMLMSASPASFATSADKAMLTETEATHTTTSTSVEFAINEKYTVPSGNTPIVVAIGSYNLAAKYIYECTPKIDPDVFLKAVIENRSDLDLIDGEANVYFENSFVGRTIIIGNSTSDTLQLSLGRDKNITVSRQRESTNTKRSTIGSSVTESRMWKINIRNNRSQTVDIQIYDQIPVSTNSSIEVIAEELSGATLDQTTGRVVWNVPLQQGSSKELKLSYKVKYPKDKKLIIE